MSDIALLAIRNTEPKDVVATTSHLQATVMALGVGERIGAEVHDEHDQVVLCVAGAGVAIVGNKRVPIGPGSIVLVPAGTRHDVANESPTSVLRLAMLYSPPKYPDPSV
jgi:mannose-6-phosphate isomerase-like protein (cupin superfamily)